MENYKKLINDLLKDPEKLKLKKPFVRGTQRETTPIDDKLVVPEFISALLSQKFHCVSQETTS